MSEVLRLQAFLQSHFAVVVDKDDLLKELEEKLALRIKHLIEHNHERLFQILYQIDVHESQVQKAFDLGELDRVSLALAKFILERQIKKLDTRGQEFKD